MSNELLTSSFINRLCKEVKVEIRMLWLHHVINPKDKRQEFSSELYVRLKNQQTLQPFPMIQRAIHKSSIEI